MLAATLTAALGFSPGVTRLPNGFAGAPRARPQHRRAIAPPLRPARPHLRVRRDAKRNLMQYLPFATPARARTWVPARRLARGRCTTASLPETESSHSPAAPALTPPALPLQARHFRSTR